MTEEAKEVGTVQPAAGKRGHLLYTPVGNPLFFRIYDEHDKTKFVDYDIFAADIEIEIVDPHIELYESPERNKIDFSRKVLGKAKTAKPRIPQMPDKLEIKTPHGTFTLIDKNAVAITIIKSHKVFGRCHMDHVEHPTIPTSVGEIKSRFGRWTHYIATYKVNGEQIFLRSAFTDTK